MRDIMWPILEILGKTVRGVIIKQNEDYRGSPNMQLFLVFDDDSAYELYTLPRAYFQFASGLDGGGMGAARRAGSPPNGPMKTILDAGIDDQGEIIKQAG
jgi:hypothetical protein